MKKQLKKYNSNVQKGSFLLELLIAFAIISIAMTVIVDSFITSQRSYRTIADQTNLTRSLSMVLEDMSREVKVSEKFDCGTGTTPCSGTEFYMEHVEGLNGQLAGENVSYTINANKEIEKTTDLSGTVSTSPLTSPAIEVTEFNVKTIGEAGISQVQTFVTIVAHAKNDPTLKVNLQTSFTERIR